MSFIMALGALSYVCVGRKGMGKMADGKKEFSVEWISALVHWHKLNYTQPVLACVLPSCQCTLRVSRKMIWTFPLLTILLPWKGSLARPSLPRPWQIKEWVAHFFQTGRSQEEKQQHRLGIPALWMCCFFFLALMLTDAKTNMKKRNKRNGCASMFVQQPAMSVLESVIYFVIHWNS